MVDPPAGSPVGSPVSTPVDPPFVLPVGPPVGPLVGPPSASPMMEFPSMVARVELASSETQMSEFFSGERTTSRW